MGDQIVGSVQDEVELKPEVWFVERWLAYKPAHFVTASAPLTKESAQWIQSKLVGRYAHDVGLGLDDDFFYVTKPAFEDPAEALLYELTWS